MQKSISPISKSVVNAGLASAIQRANVRQNVAIRMVFCLLMLAVWAPSLMAVAPQISSLSIHDNDGDGWGPTTTTWGRSKLATKHGKFEPQLE